MTKLAYLECPTGIAGDMCLGALVHAGVPLSYLTEQLKALGISQEYQLRAETVSRSGQQATKVHVDVKKPATSTPKTDKTRVGRSMELSNNATTNLTTETKAGVGFVQEERVATKNGGTMKASHPYTVQEVGHHHHHHHDHHSHHHHSHHHHHPKHQSSELNEVAHHHTRTLPDIETLIRSAALPPRVKDWSLAIFKTLAIAEGAVHGTPPEQVHFHEVGATDAIVDIVGTCLGLDWLGVEGLYCSALPTGGGVVRAAHGRLPVPVPAVMKLWEGRQVPVYHNGIDRELVTPTGAAIVVTLADRFGPPPPMILQKVGLGAGSRDLPIPNILRLWLGNALPKTWKDLRQQLEPTQASPQNIPHQPPVVAHPKPKHQPTQEGTQSAAPISPLDWMAQPDVLASVSPTISIRESSVPAATGHSQETISVLETQVDDLNPQAIGYLFDALFTVGAVDVFTQAVGMKKSRPGVLITVICRPEHVPQCEQVLFRETTTLGIRHAIQQRTALKRTHEVVQTNYGPIQVKVAWSQDPKEILNVQPEYEDCARVARQYDLPWREVHNLALRKWYEQRDLKLATL